MSEPGTEMVPEKNWHERYMTVFPYPHLRPFFYAVARRHGRLVAIFLLSVAQEVSEKHAIVIAKELLRVEKFEDLYRLLEKRMRLLGDGRVYVARLLDRLRVQYIMEGVVEEYARITCSDKKAVKEEMKRLAQAIVKYGYFVSPFCIRLAAEAMVCSVRVPQNACLFTMRLARLLDGS